MSDFSLARQFVSSVIELVDQRITAEYALAEYSSGYTQVSGFERRERALQSVLAIQQSDGLTFTGSALERALSFAGDNSDGARLSSIVVLTDGQTSPADRLTFAASVREAAENKFTEVYAVGVGSNLNQIELRQLAGELSGDTEADRTFTATTFNELANLTTDLADALESTCSVGKSLFSCNFTSCCKNRVDMSPL